MIKNVPPRKESASTGLSRSDKFKLVGYPALGLVGLSLLYHLTCIQNQKTLVSKTVERWQTTYHLDDEQAEQIKQIEMDFHGNGSLFSFRAIANAEEKRLHHEKISRLMSVKDGRRFLEVMEESGGRH